MIAAYVDSSIVLARLFGERSDTKVRQRISQFEYLYSALLLEAEVLSAAQRERIALEDVVLHRIRPIFPSRSLRPEIERVLNAGYVRGADCLHLATALYLAPDPTELTFLTLDVRQRAVAKSLGFPV